MRTAIAWLLFLLLVAWSGLVGWLAGIGAAAARRHLPDGVALGLAALLVFGLALAIGGRAVRPAFVLAGAIGFALAFPAALRRETGPGGVPGGGDSAPTDTFRAGGP